MNVLVIDDHPLILHAMRSVVQQLAERVEVVTVTGSQAARDALSAGAEFDLALLDLQLGYDDGFALLEELRTAYPAMPIVVVAASDFRDDVMRAIDLGAMGFVPKCSSNEVLVSALEMVLSAHYRIGTIASTAIAPPRPSRRST
jgi:DNA-binding NarL/FixJ family response regulator